MEISFGIELGDGQGGSGISPIKNHGKHGNHVGFPGQMSKMIRQKYRNKP